MYATVSEYRTRLALARGLSDDQRAKAEQAIRQAEADDLRAGTIMLEGTSASLAARDEEMANETHLLADAFSALTAAIERPDTDLGVLRDAYQEFDSRARALGAQITSWSVTAARLREQAANPAQVAEDLRAKWAAKSVTNREQILHLFPDLP